MKQYGVVFTAEAAAELQAAIDYYDALQPGLGTRFATEVNVQRVKLTEAPHARAVRYGVVRFAIVEHFPYLAQYWIDDIAAVVTVVSIISHHQDPETAWRPSSRDYELEPASVHYYNDHAEHNPRYCPQGVAIFHLYTSRRVSKPRAR